VSVLARTDPPRPRSISTLLTQIWLLERARLQSWHRCSGVQNTEPYRCLMLHVPPLLCTYRFFWATMIKPLISSLASVLIKARQQSQWILVLLDNAAVHSPHAVLQVCHLNFCPSACPDHFLSRCMHACGCGISLGFCRRCSEDQRVISERSGRQQVGSLRCLFLLMKLNSLAATTSTLLWSAGRRSLESASGAPRQDQPTIRRNLPMPYSARRGLGTSRYVSCWP
jgi:hypothetical protein